MRLDNFEGPFDLLLGLIAKHKLDITEVALSQVTDEFIAHVKLGGVWDLEQTTSFLLVAATLLDLKAARLLPQGDVEDEEDLALLEARDLLFARLMQYRAFKQVAAVLEERLAAESLRHPRAVGLEERFATLLPEVLIGIGLEQFAQLAARAMEPKPVLEVSLQHIHAAKVSACASRRQIVVDRLRRSGTMTFRALCGDSPDTPHHGGAVPVAARALPRGGGRLRPGDPAGRADRALDRGRGRRVRDQRRVRRRTRRTPSRHTMCRVGRATGGESAQDVPGRQAERGDDVSETVEVDDTLAVAVAELRPALEAILMVSDQPLDQVTLRLRGGLPGRRGRGRAGRPGGGVRRAGPRLRAALGGRRVAVLHPRGVRRRSSRRSCSTASRPG